MMLHDSDASTVAPESPVNISKGPKNIYSPENIKQRLRQPKNNKVDVIKERLATSRRHNQSSNRTNCKNDNTSMKKKNNCKRKVSRHFPSKTTTTQRLKNLEESRPNEPPVNKNLLLEDKGQQESDYDTFDKVAEKFKVLQENWQLRWEILHLKWQLFQTTTDIHQREEEIQKRTTSEDAPVIEISSIWRMFMDNMSLVKIDESQGGDILKYSLEGTREFYIVQERHVSSNRQISFLLHILHKIIAIYKQPEVQLDSNCFEQKNELFCKVWKSLTTTLCYLKDPCTHFQKFSQPLHQFLIGLFADIFYGNIPMVASEAILEVFFHGTTTQLTDYLGRLMKMAIINVLERFKTLLVDTQPPHLFSKRYTDLVLLLESLPFSVWEIQDESTLEQIAATITCSFPFIATLLYAASLYHKHRSSTLVFPSMGLQDKEHYT